MMRKYFGVVCLLLTFILLAGCGPMLKISGQIVDQKGEPVQGIFVKATGVTDETDAYGRFQLNVQDVSVQTYVKLIIDGTHLGFAAHERSIQLYPGVDAVVGQIYITRLQAMITGNVIHNYTTTGMTTQSSTPANLATMAGEPQYPEGEIIVKFKDTIQPQSVGTMFTDLNVKVLTHLPKSKVLKIKAEGNIATTIEALSKRNDVEYAEPNYYIYPLGDAQMASSFTYCNDPYYSDQWNLQAINLENAWSYGSRGDASVKVAVLDTGIQRGVYELEPHILWDLGKDIIDDDFDPSVSWDEHGTYVASIIAATPDNATGMAGINYNVGIVPVRILRETNDSGYWGTTEDLLRGLEWAIYDADVDIINLSVAVNVTGYSNVQSIADMLALAEEEGVLVVAAAGNEKESTPVYPARDWRVLAVGAVGPTLQPASYSARNVDIYAPGGDYYTYPVSNANGIRALSKKGLAWVQGTSYASAHVAGVAALILAEEPNLTPSALRYRLTGSSLDLVYDDGAGLLDAYRAVTDQDHARIFVFCGTESYNYFTYQTEESTYTYQQDGENYFKLASVAPGFRHLYAWVDRDNDSKLSRYDLFAERILDLEEGDAAEVELNLATYY